MTTAPQPTESYPPCRGIQIGVTLGYRIIAVDRQVPKLSVQWENADNLPRLVKQNEIFACVTVPLPSSHWRKMYNSNSSPLF